MKSEECRHHGGLSSTACECRSPPEMVDAPLRPPMSTSYSHHLHLNTMVATATPSFLLLLLLLIIIATQESNHPLSLPTASLFSPPRCGVVQFDGVRRPRR